MITSSEEHTLDLEAILNIRIFSLLLCQVVPNSRGCSENCVFRPQRAKQI